MTLTGEYEPSTQQWVRDQVAAFEASNGADANTLPDGNPIVVITSVGAKSGKIRKNPASSLLRISSHASNIRIGLAHTMR